MSPANQKNQSHEQSTPDEYIGATTPSATMLSDHSFTLQAIMDLQKSNGKLEGAISSLHQSIDKVDNKLDKIEDTVSGVTKIIYAAGVVLAITICIGGFFLDKAWDLVVHQIQTTDSRPAPPAPEIRQAK